MKIISLKKLPFVVQGKKSANCGPCTLKMVGDYYKIRKNNGDEFTVASLNRLLKVSTVWGCEKSDMRRVAYRMGLRLKKVTFNDLSKYLIEGKPIISLFIDENGEGHYAVIKGQEGKNLIFNDSYWGRDYRRPIESFQRQTKIFGHWLWAVERK